MTKLAKRFIKYCLVGGVGALIQLGVTYSLTESMGFYYMISLGIAIVLAASWNFTMHGFWTYNIWNFKNDKTKGR